MLLLVTDKKTGVTGNRAVTGGTRVGSRGHRRHELRLIEVACCPSPESASKTRRSINAIKDAASGGGQRWSRRFGKKWSAEKRAMIMSYDLLMSLALPDICEALYQHSRPNIACIRPSFKRSRNSNISKLDFTAHVRFC